MIVYQLFFTIALLICGIISYCCCVDVMEHEFVREKTFVHSYDEVYTYNLNLLVTITYKAGTKRSLTR